ncbi:hypothetical protein EV424DRAFT_1543310 [Suillus variegatus]|nr:hypothetical protein EV424DRAFT_1543310 [Suillus variegatus]
MIDRWPENVLFANLSKISSALPELEMLLWKWELGTTCWKTLTDKDFEKIHLEHNEKLESATDGNSTHRKKYKSIETIKDTDKENDKEEEEDTPHQPSDSTSNTTPTPHVPGSTQFSNDSDTLALSHPNFNIPPFDDSTFNSSTSNRPSL